MSFGPLLRVTSKWVKPRYDAIMTAHLTSDKAGRVVIPKSLREELRLEPGDSLEMETTGESITLRPVRGNGQLRKEQGVWVFYGARISPPLRQTKCYGSFDKNATGPTLAANSESLLRHLGPGASVLRGPCAPPGESGIVHSIRQNDDFEMFPVKTFHPFIA